MMNFPFRRNPSKPKSALQEWIEAFLIAGILALFIRTFFVQAFRIPSGSMEHTLEIGDRLLVNKLEYGPIIPFTHKRVLGYAKPHRGDVIVFKFPKDPRKDFIKRIIAFGGETVHIQLGKIYINGQEVMDPPIRKNFYYSYGDGDFRRDNYTLTVPPGQFFVLGDNSASSHDSRYWGCVPEWMVVGKAALIYWPFQRMRFIQ